ncbi:MAG TPA: hypothetical protein VGI95_17355 [Caulobacteraceae bacterium]
MKWSIVLLALAGVAALAGCKKPDWSSPSGEGAQHGRYAGVGIYQAGQSWAKLTQQPSPTAGSAHLSDDQAIIVVVDSQTGETRACGDLSGYCVGMNPWHADLAKPQLAPVEFTSHGVEAHDAESATAASTNTSAK